MLIPQKSAFMPKFAVFADPDGEQMKSSVCLYLEA